MSYCDRQVTGCMIRAYGAAAVIGGDGLNRRWRSMKPSTMVDLAGNDEILEAVRASKEVAAHAASS